MRRGVVERLSSHRGCADVQPSGSGRTNGDGGGADVRAASVCTAEGTLLGYLSMPGCCFPGHYFVLLT